MENIKLVEELMVVNIFQRCTAFATENGAINLAQGVPEPIMEDVVNEKLASSFKLGWQYVNPKGLDSLRKALAVEYKNEFDTENILVTSGCTESLYLGILAASKIYGSKIAFFEPFYPYYTGLAKLINLESIPVEMIQTDLEILPDWNRIEEVFNSGVRILILNTPHNPTGWVMRINEARLLRELANKHGVFIIVDEAYRYYNYDGTDVNEAIKILYEDNDDILLVGSASKLFSVTGLRLGWMLGRKAIIDIAYAVHLYTSYCHPAPVQQMAAEIFDNRDKFWFKEINNHYIKKRDVLFNALVGMGFQCPKVSGGHFLLAGYANLNDTLSSEDFAKSFAAKYGVMPLPSDPFYRVSKQQVRFSFSVAMDKINKAKELLLKTLSSTR